MMDDSYVEPADSTGTACNTSAAQEGSKLPRVLANLMDSLGNSNRSPQAQGSAPPPNNPAVNVQELLSSIMVSKAVVLSFDPFLFI